MARETAWWRQAVIYEIYVQSFRDGNGDGVGDLAGIIEQLHYIHALGVDAVWITPFYPSPRIDGGYDIVDHRGVDPMFGTLDEFEKLLSTAHSLGLRVLLDLVPNHTSSGHVWFQEALRSPVGSSARARYFFRDGRDSAGTEPPNDWQSVFGGSAWTREYGVDGEPGQWYLHLFSECQPDLNWRSPDVQHEYKSIMIHWFERGINGFRIDVAHGLFKDANLPDLKGQWPSGRATRGHPHWDLPEVHDVYRSWRDLLDRWEDEKIFIAEALVKTPEQLAEYVRPDELHEAFNFDFLFASWNGPTLRDVIQRSLLAHASVGALPTWVLASHDVTRAVTRFGGGVEGAAKARAAALLMLSIPGSACIYQGDELGLPEVDDLPAESRRDPGSGGTDGRLGNRDGCRVPLPWSGSTPPFGFSRELTTWLPQPPAWSSFTVERESHDPASFHSLYTAALEFRRRHLRTASTELQWLPAADDVIAFRRAPSFTCIVNLGAVELNYRDIVRGAQPVLESQPRSAEPVLAAHSAAWFVDTEL